MATPGMGSGLTGSATADLGLGLGDMLQQQVADETEEERKKRMAQLAQRKQIGMGATAATAMLFGSTGGGPGGYGA